LLLHFAASKEVFLARAGHMPCDFGDDHSLQFKRANLEKGMKTRFPLTWMAPLLVVLVGCSSPSKFKNDPRAAVVGPDFLDYIEQYPMDRDTQYYYPHFGVADAKSLEAFVNEGSNSVPQNVSALMIQTPKPAPSVSEIEGKGWPELERDGIPF
jgi:hypothetical protein